MSGHPVLRRWDVLASLSIMSGPGDMWMGRKIAEWRVRGYIEEIDVESWPMWRVRLPDGDRHFPALADAEAFLECWRICNGRDPMTGDVK